MALEYPRYNPFSDNHAVSDEGFWPSFTDIMMVIVMVFLLVSIAVILNNFQLVEDLKESIYAEQKASQLVQTTKTENLTLEETVLTLEQQLIKMNRRLAALQTTNQTLQGELQKTGSLNEKQHQELQQERNRIQALNLKLNDSIQQNEQQLITLASRQEKITSLELLIKNANAYLEEKDAELADIKAKEKNSQAHIKTLQQQVTSTIERLEIIQADLEKNQQDVTDKNILLTSLKESNAENVEAKKLAEKKLQSVQLALQTTQETLKLNQDKLLAHEAALTRLQQARADEKSELERLKSEYTEMQANLEVSQAASQQRETALIALQELRKLEEKQLLSLQGDYDTLDTKYQKLLRPARSSKGKEIVSVTYRKRGGRKEIRIKPPGEESYETVREKKFKSIMEDLKEKYGEGLYVKIIIPDNSGLSYNEAWKFTSSVQKAYDYYFHGE